MTICTFPRGSKTFTEIGHTSPPSIPTPRVSVLDTKERIASIAIFPKRPLDFFLKDINLPLLELPPLGELLNATDTDF